MHIILQTRNSKKSAIPRLPSVINISSIIMIIMHKEKYNVSELLYVSKFIFFFNGVN